VRFVKIPDSPVICPAQNGCRLGHWADQHVVTESRYRGGS
jgi:hypothetical protein